MKIHLSFASLLLLVSQAVVATPIDVENSSETSVSSSGNKRPLPRSFGLVVFPAFQAFDVFGPLDALNVLGSLHKLDLAIISSSLSPVSTLISDDPDHNPMNSTMFQRILPTHTYSTAPSDLEVLIVPGGGGLIKPVPGTIEPLMEFIKKTFPKLRYLITICNGSGLVARTGVLDYRRATTNKLLYNNITALAPKVKWVGRARWVEDGKVWTSSGVSAGVDATLAWIEKVYGEEDAAHVSRILEYTRQEDSSEDPWWDYYYS